MTSNSSTREKNLQSAFLANERGRDRSHSLIAGIGYVFVSLFSLLCILPLIMVISGSFSDESLLVVNGYQFYPQNFTLLAYESLFKNWETLLGSFLVTVGLVIVGGGAGLFLTAMTGYALWRPDFKYRNTITFFIYFTTLFSGGIVASYLLMVNYLHLNNSYFSVLLPGMLSAWNIFMIKNFLKSIPYELAEVAKIDGANDFSIFMRVILPLMTPSLATIGLFLAIGYWNEWYNASLYLSTTKVRYLPLQLYLYNALNTANFLKSAADKASTYIDRSKLPSESLKMAIAVVSTLPIIFVYPFVQRYFIAGITIGSVKG